MSRFVLVIELSICEEILKFYHFFYDFIFVGWVDCIGDDWTAWAGYCTCDSEANSGNGCNEAGTTRKIFAAWASSC